MLRIPITAEFALDFVGDLGDEDHIAAATRALGGEILSMIVNLRAEGYRFTGTIIIAGEPIHFGKDE